MSFRFLQSVIADFNKFLCLLVEQKEETLDIYLAILVFNTTAVLEADTSYSTVNRIQG